MILLSHGLSAPGLFPAAIDITSRMHAHRHHNTRDFVYLFFSRILINYKKNENKKNENKTPSKIYTITVYVASSFSYMSPSLEPSLLFPLWGGPQKRKKEAGFEATCFHTKNIFLTANYSWIYTFDGEWKNFTSNNQYHCPNAT